MYYSVNNYHTYVTGFVKRGLIHASNFSTLKACNLAHVSLIPLKICSYVAFPNIVVI